MTDDTQRELYCLVDGDQLPFRVTASVENDVEDLKKLVQMAKKRSSLRDVEPANLKLSKVTPL